MNLVSQEGTPFKSAAAVHPAMVDANDAPKIAIPIILLPSGDESKDDVAAYEKALKVKHEVEWYDDQIHGWLAARYVSRDETSLDCANRNFQSRS